MSTSAFQQGALLELNGKPHQLIRKVDRHLWQVEESRSRRIVELTDEELHTFYVQGILKFPSKLPAHELKARSHGRTAHVKVLATRANSDAPPKAPLADYSPEQWDKAKVRRAYVLAVIDLPSNRVRLTAIINDVWNKIRQPARAPSSGAVIRWKGRFLRSDRDITALIDKNESKGNTRARYPDEVVEIVRTAIDTKYMTLERGTMRAALDHAKTLTKQENAMRLTANHLPVPTRRLVERLISEIPAFDRCVARHGRTAALKQFRCVISNRTTEGPLERAEMDHSQMNLFAIDDLTCLPLGRPWLTGCLDDHTRNALGVYISFEPPSYFTVARCLKQAVLPKTALLKRYPGIKNSWDAHGVMRELVVDNGPEFHSKSLENACLSLGMEIHYAARKTPWFKGKIERFLGTLNRAISSGTPGTTFENIFDRDDYDPSKHAIVRYSVLKEIVYTWIADVYHQQPHRALEMTPAVMWANSISPEEILVPDDPAQLDVILGRSEVRTLTHKGIELGGLFYNSLDMGTLRRRHGAKFDVEVRVDAGDLGRIMVFSPDKREVFSVPALRADYAEGLSAWQHKVIKRYAAERLAKCSTDGWLEAKSRIAEIIEAELTNKRRKSRTRVARYRGEHEALSHDRANAPTTGTVNTANGTPAELVGSSSSPAATTRPLRTEHTRSGPVVPVSISPPVGSPEETAPVTNGAPPSSAGHRRQGRTRLGGKPFAPVYRDRTRQGPDEQESIGTEK